MTNSTLPALRDFVPDYADAVVLAFYERLGYQADEVHFLGKRLIADD